jgi:hypothetical protein
MLGLFSIPPLASANVRAEIIGLTGVSQDFYGFHILHAGIFP